MVNIQSLHRPAIEADKPTTPDLRLRRRVSPEALRGRGRDVWLAVCALGAMTVSAYESVLRAVPRFCVTLTRGI